MYLSIYLHCIYLYNSICLSIYLSIYLSSCIYPSIHRPLHLYLSISLSSIYQPIFPLLHLFLSCNPFVHSTIIYDPLVHDSIHSFVTPHHLHIDALSYTHLCFRGNKFLQRSQTVPSKLSPTPSRSTPPSRPPPPKTGQTSSSSIKPKPQRPPPPKHSTTIRAVSSAGISNFKFQIFNLDNISLT